MVLLLVYLETQVPQYFGNLPLADESAYGTMGQGGSVWEWNEAVIGSSRGVRGGNWDGDSNNLLTSNRNYNNAPSEANFIGFRFAG